MADELAAYEAELKEYKEQLDTVLTTLKADPDNAELQTLKDELQEVISLTEAAVAELRPAPAAAEPPAAEKPKWSRENHPAFQQQHKATGASTPLSPSEHAAPTVFKVNDMVMAKWVSGDKAFYPARVTSVTGSSAAPVYLVTFKSYGNTETVRGADIRPVSTGSGGAQKRKADGAPVAGSGNPVPGPPTSSSSAAPPPPPPSHPGIISAAANIDHDLAELAKRSASSDGAHAASNANRPAKVPRKVKANKELEAGKNKWQEFAAKGKFGKGGGGSSSSGGPGGGGGPKKKESMFRTGDGVNARVGFTGSGQAMRKDQARTRHTYQVDEDEGGY